MNINRSKTRQVLSRYIINTTNLVFSVRTISCGPSLLSEKSVRNLQTACTISLVKNY